ncbi:MAG: hypothetical protein ACRCU5_05430 [Rhizobiaceae bacterium]
MAFDRDRAKKAVTKKEDNDPELGVALENAAKHQLDLQREENRHKEAVNSQNLGSIGSYFGDGKHTPIITALAVIGLSFVVAIGLYVAAYNQPDQSAIWTANAERAISIALAALAYVFGKGTAK